jgi:hypothetical protein
MAQTRKSKPKPGSTGTAAKARSQDARGGGRGRQPDKGKLAKGAAARRLQEKKRRQRTLLWSGVAVFSLLALLALIYFEGRGAPQAEVKKPVTEEARAAGRQAAGSTGLKTFPEAGRDHIAANEQPDNWNSNPPTSGDHLAAPLPPGVYDNDQDMRALVHNLEHGYVVMLYKNLPQDQLDQLREFAEARDGSKLVLAPWSGLEQDGVTLVAWQNLETMQRYNPDVVQAFVNDYMVPYAPRSTAPEPNAA